MNPKFDLTDKVFHNLTVLKFHSKDNHKNNVWKCICACGNITYVRARDLNNGHTKACGCARYSVNKKELGVAAFNHLYGRYKRDAKLKNRNFSLTKEEFREITSKNCFYCGIFPSTICKRDRMNGAYIHNGIDRIDNSIGYIMGNIRPCCTKCNFMKGFMNDVDFLEQIRNIYEHMHTS